MNGQIREIIKSAIFKQNSRLLGEEGFPLSEIPNSEQYSNEPLRALEKMGTGLMVMSLEKSEANVRLEIPAITDDRTSMRSEWKSLTLRGPFVHDPDGRFLCCLVQDESSNGLAVIDIKGAGFNRLDHKLPIDATVTPFAYVEGMFVLFVGEENIKFEKDTYYSYWKGSHILTVLDIRKISEPPAEIIYRIESRKRARVMPGTTISMGMLNEYSLQIDGIDMTTFVDDFMALVADVNPIAEPYDIKIHDTQSSEKVDWIVTTDFGKISMKLIPGWALITEGENGRAIHEIDKILQTKRHFVKV